MDAINNDCITTKIKDFTDFTGCSALQAGRVREILCKRLNYNEFGGVMSRLYFVDNAMAIGLKPSTEQVLIIKDKTRSQFNKMTQREQDAHRQRQKTAGTKTEYFIGDYVVTKAEYDYALYLLNIKNV